MLAESLGVLPEEMYFTSGGTESNNLAIRGAFLALLSHAGPLSESGQPFSLLTSELEHPSVTRTIRDFKRTGTSVTYIPAKRGELDLDALALACTPSVGLLSFMTIQNMFGYRFPLEAIARLKQRHAPQALLHSDAVQAYGHQELRPAEMGIDLLSVSSHKIGGPQGVGALYIRKGVQMFSTAFGGGQEHGLRSGTEPVALIAGFAKAVEIMQQREREAALGQTVGASQYLRGLWQRLAEGLTERFPEVHINSRSDGSPSILHFSLPGISNERAVGLLSDEGIAIGISAACDTAHVRPGEYVRPKHPLVARLAGLTAAEERSSFRASFCADTPPEAIDALLDALVRLRKQAGSS